MLIRGLVMLLLPCLLLGTATFRVGGRRWSGDLITGSFLVVALGLTLGGWLALTLAELGWFSYLTWLIGLIALTILALAGTIIRKPDVSRKLTAPRVAPLAWPGSRRPISPKLERPALLLWLALAAFLYLRPHEMILGFNDAGVYLQLGASIADKGRISYSDPFLADLPPELHSAFYRDLDQRFAFAPYYLMPAFYVTDAAKGQIVPQFYHFHAAWLALADSAGGLPLMLMLPGFWGLLAGLAFYLTTRRLFGWETAILALMALTVSALQVWFARYPTTEMLTQFLLWAGVFCLIKWDSDDSPAGVWGLLVGLFWGCLFLTRIDAYFLLLLPGLLLLWRWLSGRFRRTDWGLILLLALLTGQSLAHGLWVSPVYFLGLFQYGLWLLELNPLIFGSLALVAFITLAMAWRWRARLTAGAAWASWVKAAGATGIFVWALYNWFVRPARSPALAEVANWVSGGTVPVLDHENLVRLGWYLGPAGVWLAIFGSLWLIWRWQRPYLPLVGVGLIFTGLYIWQIQANPHQIYAMRRYVPAVVPFFVAASAAGLTALYRQRGWRQFLALGLLGIWLAGLLWSSRGFISQVDNRGLSAEFAALAERLKPGSILIFANPADGVISAGDTLAGPLAFFHGHDVLILRQSSAYEAADLRRQIEVWQAAGRTVYWLGELPAGYLDLSVADSFTYTINSQALERSYDRKPTQITEQSWPLVINKLGP